MRKLLPLLLAGSMVLAGCGSGGPGVKPAGRAPSGRAVGKFPPAVTMAAGSSRTTPVVRIAWHDALPYGARIGVEKPPKAYRISPRAAVLRAVAGVGEHSVDVVYVQTAGFVGRLSNAGGVTREPSAYLVELVGANLSQGLKNAAGPNPPKPPVVEFMVVLVNGRTGTSELIESGDAHAADAGPYISRASAEANAAAPEWGTTPPKLLSAKLETVAAASAQLGSRAAALTIPNDAMVWVLTLKGTYNPAACLATCVPVLYDQVYSVVEDAMTGQWYASGYFNAPLTGHISRGEATAAAREKAQSFGTPPAKVLAARLETVSAADRQAGMPVTTAPTEAGTKVWLVWLKGPCQPACNPVGSPCPAVANAEYFVAVQAISAEVLGIGRNADAPGAPKD